MKIAILTEYYPDHKDPASGVYVHLRSVGYRQAGHDVRVYRVRSQPLESIEYDGVSVASGGHDSLRAEIVAFSPDVAAVHTPYPGTGHVLLAEAIKVPRVYWIHGYEAMLTAFHGYHRGFARFLSLFHDVRKLGRLRRSMSGAAAVVYVSNWMRATAERATRYRHPLSAVIANPVDTERFRPEPDRRLRSDRPRGLALRGLSAKYGLDLAVAAYSEIQGTELTIVGTGPDADRLRRQIESSGAAVNLEERMVPHREVPALMKDFDYFVAPARTEAQGVAMCEAMACGLPVVATRAGGIPEFVREGKDGLLTSPGNRVELRQAILQLIHDPARARLMGQSAREHIQMKCSASSIILQELDLMSGTVGHAASR
jgi:glycosyltransferase involved in cell wall biosynthesis